MVLNGTHLGHVTKIGAKQQLPPPRPEVEKNSHWSIFFRQNRLEYRNI